MGVYQVKGADRNRGYNLLFQFTINYSKPPPAGAGIPLSEQNRALKQKQLS